MNHAPGGCEQCDPDDDKFSLAALLATITMGAWVLGSIAWVVWGFP